jgi:hypothetical protein
MVAKGSPCDFTGTLIVNETGYTASLANPVSMRIIFPVAIDAYAKNH